MEQWTRIVVDKIRPLLITNGGPIIMLQIENEYGGYDEYAKWAVKMARNITTDVPWEMCHSVPQCGQLNQNANEDSKVLCAINGFWMDEGGGGGQPGPEFFDKLWSKNKDQPALWTEDQGWFDKWGYGQRVRWTSDQLYGMARFFAYGGSYHNLYMLTGGNNYERRAGGDATTGCKCSTESSIFELCTPCRALFISFFFFGMTKMHPTQLLTSCFFVTSLDSRPTKSFSKSSEPTRLTYSVTPQRNRFHCRVLKRKIWAINQIKHTQKRMNTVDWCSYQTATNKVPNVVCLITKATLTISPTTQL
jgi:hypothetical protein